MKPIIAITMGDPAGIGPEIIQKVYQEYDLCKFCVPIVFGNSEILKKRYKFNKINIFSVKDNLKNFTIGTPTKETGFASLKYIDASIEKLKSKEIDAIVTCPINKAKIAESVPNFIGHTEYFASKFNVKDYMMMFYSTKIKLALLTTHIKLCDVNKFVTDKNVLNKIQALNKYLNQYFKIKNPKIGVLALNPHCGEDGLMGEEDQRITKAINKANSKNIKIEGPFSADSYFHNLLVGKYSHDATLAMYHDQGLGPIKLLYFNKIVNVTLGLPFIRTSVGHGCAYDIAGKNIASSESLYEAIKLASILHNNRHGSSGIR
jgi:4-hydroxythreonine-4-phosphate dehydrogenase